MARYRLNVNGGAREVRADPATPLLWVLRDGLELTGTKYGCGIAQCGACTVLVDGAPKRSCVLPVAAVREAKVTTIEGVGADAVGRRVQDAWVAGDVPQCGYCQSGMVVATTALLKREPAPSRQAVDDALRGHICRCGTYERIRTAVALAAEKRA
ncbi:MAG: (2Fe-2S)-binding protein [Candidatus Eremiobacteraeota bacterium]|nr:(2Fe-2S)-binding protein [Candidatus Eremiobacteraeota bacterium]